MKPTATRAPRGTRAVIFVRRAADDANTNATRKNRACVSIQREKKNAERRSNPERRASTITWKVRSVQAGELESNTSAKSGASHVRSRSAKYTARTLSTNGSVVATRTSA